MFGAFGEFGVAAIPAVIGPAPEEIDAEAQTPGGGEEEQCGGVRAGVGELHERRPGEHDNAERPPGVDVAWVFQRNGNEPERGEANTGDDEVGEEDGKRFGHGKSTHESLK